jgi:hypothetical protein
MMSTIKAITDHDGRNQRHHGEAPKCSRDEHPSNVTRRAMVISLGATSQPRQQMQQRHHEDIVNIMTILVLRQQSSSKEHQSPQRKHDKHNQQPGGPLNGKPQVDWAYSCLTSPATRTLRTITKHVMKNSQKETITNAAMHLDQQKALVFDADSCRYDVILGADFLSKTGIDVKYSTGTIE